jgi:hypothetical protein
VERHHVGGLTYPYECPLTFEIKVSELDGINDRGESYHVYARCQPKLSWTLDGWCRSSSMSSSGTVSNVRNEGRRVVFNVHHS